MTHRWTATVIVAIVVLAGCGSPRSKGRAAATAYATESHGDGYRRADQPDAIADLLEHYAVQKGGQVLASDVYHGPRPGGHVDVLFHVPGGSK